MVCISHAQPSDVHLFYSVKGVFNNDTNYLKNKLSEIKQTGNDLFTKIPLLRFSLMGFGQRREVNVPSAINKLGDIPYLNGGLFLKHQIEELHGQAY